MSRPRKPSPRKRTQAAAEVAPAPADRIDPDDLEAATEAEPVDPDEDLVEPAVDGEGIDPEVLPDATLADDVLASDMLIDEAALDAVPLPVSDRSLVAWDPLSAYIQETRRYALITREEEHDLAVRYRDHGDMDAAKRLVTANLRLVVKIAHEYRKAHQVLLDLIQEGNVGLVQAVLKFDPYRGVKLSTYAAWWIRAYILKSILNNWRMVKIGTTQAQRKLFFNLRKQKEDLERMGITPSSAEVAKALDVTETEVIEMERRLAAPDLSLSTPLGHDDGSNRTFYDVIPEDKSLPDEQVESAQFRTLLREKLERFAENLTGRDKVIYDKRLMAYPPLTLKEIGDSYGVSRERARQLEKRLLGKLREYLKQEMGDAVEIAMGWET